MTVLWLSPIAGILSYVLTRLVIGYAITHRVVDIPNDRSSHNRSVPRGGGLAIALSFQACLFVCWATELVATNFMIALSGSGGLVALIGFIDDHRSVPVGWRLTVHFLAAAVALFSLGGVPELRIFGVIFSAGWQSSVLGAIAIVWFLNLYNFMDGTDLLAGIEAVTVCMAGALLCLLTSPGDPTWMVPMLLAASVAGFLCWNLPPAKVFMGDVGSGFLGVTLAIIALQAGWIKSELFWSWLILFGVFVVDATVTLITRAVRREKISQAHSSHAYQRIARQLGSHGAVALAVGVVNLVWLLPISAAVALSYLDSGLGVLLSYLPLVLLALMFGAGRET